jgi:ribosomal-protein-alanine N-acetyltransferase
MSTMDVFLVAPSRSDIHDLLEFESRNRRFFEDRLNARPADYYSVAGVTQAIETALADALNDRGYQFLLKTIEGNIVGRVNLAGVKRDHFHCAVLGYRIAESECGKGLASEAVRQIVVRARDLGLARIEADASVENLASVRVLLRNGFVQFGHSKRSLQLGGIWYDRLHFERHCDQDQ